MIAMPTDLGDAAVVAALGNAVSHNVVVVVRAGSSGAAARDGLLRVGAVNADDSLVRKYPAGAVDVLAPGDAAEPVRRGWAACDPLYVSAAYATRTAGPLISKDRALFLADKNVLVVGAKPADDGEGVVVKLLDAAGQARSVGVWPAAYTFKQARRTNLVEMNADPTPVASDGKAAVDLAAWGVAALRLFG